MKALFGTVALLLLAAGTPAAASTNIVVNGGFEDGLTGWQFYAWNHLPTPDYDIGQYDGNWAAGSGCNVDCPMVQTLSTVAGQKYDLSFAYNAGVYGGPAGVPGNYDLRIYWGSDLIDHIYGGGQLGWRVFAFDNLLATGGSTDLTFMMSKTTARIGIDDVAVSLSSAVPEPSTWAMLLVGFGMIGWTLRANRSSLQRQRV